MELGDQKQSDKDISEGSEEEEGTDPIDEFLRGMQDDEDKERVALVD